MSIESSVRTALEAAIAEGMALGAVCEVSVAGVSTGPIAVGAQATVDGEGGTIAPSHRESVVADTRYDIASVTKLFSAVTILRLVDAGILDLDAPIGEWLDEYSSHGKSGVTLRHLLSHTSGLPGTWDGWHAYVADEGGHDAHWLSRDRSAALGSIIELPLETPTGTAYSYSCMGYITAMACAEMATGRDWGGLVRENVIEPLGLRRTGFGSAVEDCAPTEYQPQIGRGVVRGVVHDETAYALEGISANAGIFSTASELRMFGEAMVGGFSALLSAATSDAFWTDQLPRMLGADALAAGAGPSWGQGLGPRIAQANWMSEGLPTGRGHSGFTGPSVLVDRERKLVISFVNNRVHPTRNGPEGNGLRLIVSEAALSAIGG